MDIMYAIKHFMMEKHMTAYALSKKSGISQSTLSNIVKRGNDPTIDTLVKICDGLGIALSEFFYFMESETENKEIEQKCRDCLACRRLIEGYLKLDTKQKSFVMRMIEVLQN